MGGERANGVGTYLDNMDSAERARRSHACRVSD